MAIPKFRAWLGRLLHLKAQAQLSYTGNIPQNHLWKEMEELQGLRRT